MPYRCVKLKDCCTVVGGATPKRNIDEYWGGDIPWITPKDVSKLDGNILNAAPEFITEAGYKSCAAQMLPPGTVLLTSRAPIGNVAIAGTSLCTNQGFKSLIPSNDVDPTFLFYCIKHNSEKLKALGNGATFKEVSKSVVESFEILIPTLGEQKRIATILDKADALRRKRQQAIELADQFLRSVFLEMFGDPVSNPKGWEKKCISEIASVITGNTPPRSESDNYGQHIEWIKSDNINGTGHFLTPAKEGLSNVGIRKARVVESGAVLVTCIAGSPDSIGKAAIADRAVSFNQQINALVPSDSVKTEYLYSAILFGKRLIQNASTNSMKGMVSKGNLEKVLIPVPPLSVQEKYSELFRRFLLSRKKLEKSRDQIIALNGSLSCEAFAG